jgi:hypothetical protein
VASTDRRNAIVCLLLLALTLTGCRSVNRGMTERILSKARFQGGRLHYGTAGKPYALNDRDLKDVEFAGTFTRDGVVCVCYPNGLYSQAESIADLTAGLLSEVQERLGVVIRLKCRIYLLRVDEIPQNANIDIATEPNEFPMPLFVKAGDESWQSILVQNQMYPYVLLHELVEMSMTRGLGGGPVLPDVEGGMMGLHGTLNNYTRWFREGLANYAGYVASEITAKSLALHPEEGQPFSSLRKVGDKIFSWSQYARTSQSGYYDAASGLFLLIREEFGEQAIRDIVKEVARRQNVDGRDLIDIVNRRISGDIEARVRAFTFPHVGLGLTPVTSALVLNDGLDIKQGLFVESVEGGGPADQAGLKRKDIITAVGTTTILSPADFELAMFRAGNLPTVTLAVQRKDAGTLLIALPIAKSVSPTK